MSGGIRNAMRGVSLNGRSDRACIRPLSPGPCSCLIVPVAVTIRHIKGNVTLAAWTCEAKLAQRFDGHSRRTGPWCERMLRGAADVFVDSCQVELPVEAKRLRARIGEAKLANDYWNRALEGRVCWGWALIVRAYALPTSLQAAASGLSRGNVPFASRLASNRRPPGLAGEAVDV